MNLLSLSPLPLALLLASCSPHGSAPPAAPVVHSEPAAINVTTTPAEEKSMPRYLRVTGELRGGQRAMVAADAAGKVVFAPIERGTVVKAGDVLIKLDERHATLSLQEAEATLASSQSKLDWQKAELTRNEPLARSKAISDTEFQKLKIDLASAEATNAASLARRDMAKKTLADTSILAPFGGTVGERLTEVGEYVSNNSQIASLVSTDKLRLTLYVPETAIGSLSVDQSVAFNVPAYPSRDFTGKVKFIGAAVRDASRDLIVEAEVINADGKLKPGMFAEGRLTLAEIKGVTVPLTALRTDGSTRKVFVVQDGRISERLVEVGETKGDLVEIRRGVAKGEAVVTVPPAETTDGLKVNLTAGL